MKFLIVAATNAELANVFKHYKLPDEQLVKCESFDILITGVGMTATAFALGKHLNSNYHLVLNVGIAGSFNQNIALGSLLNIETDTFAELGAEDHDLFLTINDLGFGENTYRASYNYNNLPKVKGITINKVHGNANSITKVVALFNPTTESMEGAAVFYACQQLQLPCLQIRAISNYVEPRNKESWEMALAIQNLNEWLINYIAENKD